MSSSDIQEFLEASGSYTLTYVQELLSKKGISVNCKDILIKNINDIQNLFFHKIQIFNNFWCII